MMIAPIFSLLILASLSSSVATAVVDNVVPSDHSGRRQQQQQDQLDAQQQQHEQYHRGLQFQFPGLSDLTQVLEFLPDECDLDFNTAAGCFVANSNLLGLPFLGDMNCIGDCLDVVSGAMVELPDVNSLQTCEDIEEPLCPITTCCEPCLDIVNTLIKCVIANSIELANIVSNVSESLNMTNNNNNSNDVTDLIDDIMDNVTDSLNDTLDKVTDIVQDVIGNVPNSTLENSNATSIIDDLLGNVTMGNRVDLGGVLELLEVCNLTCSSFTRR